MKKKCYIYIRVSTTMQVDGYSLEAQKERLMKFAEFQEMEVGREYCDAGKSGKSITGRPEFQRMLQDVSEERDGVAFILVFKLSRFGRNAADVLNSLQFIQDYGVNLICVEDGIDSSKDSGKLTITVLSAVAEIERENILVQTMEGRKQKAREGKWNGGQAPFGYDLDSKNSTLVVNEEEAEIVRIIYDKFGHTDMGADAICNYLNQRGYTKKKVRGHELNYFARGLIMKILDNPVYTGKIAYGKNVMEKVKGTRDEYRRVKTDDYLLADGLHEAIVDEETWEAAREKRKRTGVKWNKTHSLEHEHILSGLLKCPVCGAGMAGTVRRRKNKKSGEYKDDFYYRCQHRRKIDEEHFCDFKPSLNQNEINAEVEWFIRGMIADERFHEYIGERLQEKVDVSNLEEERDQLKGQLQQVVGAKNKLLVMLDALDAGDKHYARKFQDMRTVWIIFMTGSLVLRMRLPMWRKRLRQRMEDKLVKNNCTKSCKSLIYCMQKCQILKKRNLCSCLLMQLSYTRKRWMMGASSGRLIWHFRCIMKVLKAKQFGCSTKTQSRRYVYCPNSMKRSIM